MYLFTHICYCSSIHKFIKGERTTNVSQIWVRKECTPFCQTPVRHLRSVGGKAERRSAENHRNTAWGAVGIGKALGFLPNCRINRDSNREEETVPVLRAAGWCAERPMCWLAQA